MKENNDTPQTPFRSHSLSADLAELVRLTDLLEEFGQRESIPFPVVASMNVCLDEIITNVIKHGYEANGITGPIELELGVENGFAVAVSSDRAIPYDPLSRVAPDTSLSIEERPIGGLGIHLVKEMMDEVAYEYRDGWNRLTIRKRIPAE